MAERVRLRPERAPERRPVLGLALLLGVGSLLLALRPWWTPRVPQGQLVEVSGHVARPGLYVVDPPTLAAAVEAAGGKADGLPETLLAPGDAVRVAPDGARVVPMGDPSLVALPVDVNAHPAEALAAVPGVGPGAAERIVAWREAHGPFHGLDEVARVPGVRADAVAGAAPMLTIGAAGPRPPLDLNRADAAALEALPGIGPALAARIVADREARGAFPDVAALDRVEGIGPALVGRLAPLVRVEP